MILNSELTVDQNSDFRPKYWLLLPKIIVTQISILYLFSGSVLAVRIEPGTFGILRCYGKQQTASLCEGRLISEQFFNKSLEENETNPRNIVYVKYISINAQHSDVESGVSAQMRIHYSQHTFQLLSL
jgi:hypothetical protein